MSTYAEKMWGHVLEFLFPRSSEVRRLEAMTAREYAWSFSRSFPTNSSVQSMFDYKDARVRLAIHEVKYRKNRIIASKFGEIVYGEIKRIVHSHGKALLVPVPSSKSRRRTKGFNQTELLVEEIIKNDTENLFEYAKDVLVRVKETIPQTEMKSKAGRKKNSLGSFAVKGPERLKDKEVVIIDDVLTTGSTLKEAMSEIKKAGARKVWGFTIAH